MKTLQQIESGLLVEVAPNLAFIINDLLKSGVTKADILRRAKEKCNATPILLGLIESHIEGKEVAP